MSERRLPVDEILAIAEENCEHDRARFHIRQARQLELAREDRR